ncbi:hypothetical protein L596_013274 [Steinernema carpocapsae]|uniref:ZP domain-containing protein n=1 Tax=Steinernema carpocapsae TaxID=34508 RepID=A0A4U5NZN6_STECR|nr:hypothetical protein L596_013274 [Steinernema carpocapsae]
MSSYLLAPLLLASTVIQFSFSASSCFSKPGHLNVVFNRSSCDVVVGLEGSSISKRKIENCPDYCMFVTEPNRSLVLANEDEIVVVPISKGIFDLARCDEGRSNNVREKEAILDCENIKNDASIMYGKLLSVAQERCSPTSQQIFIPLDKQLEATLSDHPDTRWRQIRERQCGNPERFAIRRCIVMLAVAAALTLLGITVIAVDLCCLNPNYQRQGERLTRERPCRRRWEERENHNSRSSYEGHRKAKESSREMVKKSSLEEVKKSSGEASLKAEHPFFQDSRGPFVAESKRLSPSKTTLRDSVTDRSSVSSQEITSKTQKSDRSTVFGR